MICVAETEVKNSNPLNRSLKVIRPSSQSFLCYEFVVIAYMVESHVWSFCTKDAHDLDLLVKNKCIHVILSSNHWHEITFVALKKDSLRKMHERKHSLYAIS